MKTILHVDFDSFFASVEQQFNPKLRGKPIGVTAQNGRTCIIAASREAKKMGVKSPSRTFEALRIVPSMIFVPAHFAKYWEITQKFLDICKDFSPYVELFSLDEVFMDVTSTQNLFGGKYQLINKIRERIKNEIGECVTVSVGISHNKLLAKLASGINKPNGLLEITPENIWQVYAEVKLTDFCGIGRRIEERLRRLRIYTPLELHKAPLDVLLKEFKDAEGHFLKNLGNGVDDSVVVPYYFPAETKSVGRNYCLPQNQYDQRVVMQNVYELCEEVVFKLRKLSKKARTAGIYLGGSRNVHGRKTTNEYFDSGQEMFSLCQKILDENGFYFGENDYIRRISVWVGSLEESSYLQASLFDFDVKRKKIVQTVDMLNEKFGDHTIRRGFLLNADKLTTVPNGFMADRYERQKLTAEFNPKLI
ncbi:MAG TPA: DNA polymerase IV [Patescibacteria group bacterium]|jgi:DNA polymerase-4|nr:DNA polymerase IV [Patescibacteria group bacterium]